MRKFLWEYDTTVTLDELREEWRNNDEDGRTFREYLDACMYWNNGALTEILTEDTPREYRERAVIDCIVWYSDESDDYCEEWLDLGEIAMKKGFGCKVQIREEE